MSNITTAFRLSLGALALLAAGAAAQAPNYPVLDSQRATAQQVAARGVPLSALSPTAPDQYTVVRGDTLWAISGRFLQQPWRWPELWGMNLEQIRNPHLIFPGQVLVLERDGDFARLRLAGASTGANGDVRLSPTVRSEPLDQAIFTIPAAVLEPMLARPLIVEPEDLELSGRIFELSESRVLAAAGSRIYARQVEGAPGSTWQIYQAIREIRDPDDSSRLLGHEARYLGSARVDQAGDPAALTVVQAREEVKRGDRLINVVSPGVGSYVPRSAPVDLEGSVAMIHAPETRDMAGQYSIVVFNRGAADGLEVGHVAQLFRPGRSVVDRTGAAPETVTLPDQVLGEALVYQVADQFAYALVMRATGPLQVQDRFRGMP